MVIDHGNSVATLYGHLSQIDVSAGDTVDANDDVIGLVGSTGWFGAHLHFKVHVRGLPIDPMLALGDTRPLIADGGSLTRIWRSAAPGAMLPGHG